MKEKSYLILVGAALCLLIAIILCTGLLLNGPLFSDYFDSTGEYLGYRWKRIAFLLAISLSFMYLVQILVLDSGLSARSTSIASILMAAGFAVLICYTRNRLMNASYMVLWIPASALLARTALLMCNLARLREWAWALYAAICLGASILLTLPYNSYAAGDVPAALWLLVVSAVSALAAIRCSCLPDSAKGDKQRRWVIGWLVLAAAVMLVSYTVFSEPMSEYLLAPGGLQTWFDFHLKAPWAAMTGTGEIIHNLSGDIKLMDAYVISGVAFYSPLLWIRFAFGLPVAVLLMILLVASGVLAVVYLRILPVDSSFLTRVATGAYVSLVAAGVLAAVFCVTKTAVSLLYNVGSLLLASMALALFVAGFESRKRANLAPITKEEPVDCLIDGETIEERKDNEMITAFVTNKQEENIEATIQAVESYCEEKPIGRLVFDLLVHLKDGLESNLAFDMLRTIIPETESVRLHRAQGDSSWMDDEFIDHEISSSIKKFIDLGVIEVRDELLFVNPALRDGLDALS